ncbi:hypothetical protein [uncultured Fibrella sp.]|uniref:hypothetical protein n=1 Tax=uncultured Fibrella sp. TaxID=1284596 RepID=UPI0035CC9E30
MSHRPTFDAQLPPLQWVGGHQVQDLLNLVNYATLSLRDRWSLIDRIDQKQDQYQKWLTKMPTQGTEYETVKNTLVQLKAKRLEIYLTIKPAFAGKIHRASQHPTHS